MESATLSAVSDDREEGEIVDDDFEDISDNSIVSIYSGKSVSSKEHLPAISLSSVTDVEETRREKIRHRQKSRKKISKSYKKRRNSHRRPSLYSDSDSDYMELDRKLQNQIKAAIRVDDIEERHTNSLRSRLRGMTKLDNDSDNSMEKIDNSNDKIEQKESSDEGDTELTQLRLEALRTAVLNKFMHRKKRKMKEVQDHDVLSDISIKTDNSETNKENTHNGNEINVPVEENPQKKLCLEKPVENVEKKIEVTNNVVIDNTPPEDDEDVLRALLLASMSKKITNETDSKKTVPSSNKNSAPKPTLTPKSSNSEVSKFTVKNITHFKNRVVKNNIVVTKNQAVQIPKIKPLIIKVNGDSDSDDDPFNKTKQNPPAIEAALKPLDLEIESTVERFLKEQRAKVEAQLPSVPKTPPIMKNSSVILEKSSVKLLPKVKQIEYQKLLQRLKNAEKKPRVRRLSNRYNSEGKTVGITAKKLVRTKTVVNKQAVAPKIEQVPDVRAEARILHKTLKEMQIQRNGRLQMQEKYKVLMPIVKKINEASTERKKCDEEVKRLFEQLTEAKKKLIRCQQDFSAHVRELIGQKDQIDKSAKRPKPAEEPKTRFTSTPIRGKPLLLESFESSSTPATTPNQPIKNAKNVAIIAIDPSAEIQQEKDLVDGQINPGDPNDIDKLYSKEKSSMPKYISPLDNVKRVAKDDPFCIVCPYDVDGNCRDPECIYRHLFK